MTDDEKPITLSREDLYELTWSKPMSELAKDFGISDVALAKRCERLGIPVPGRGYWARVDSGQNPYRPKLPKREPRWRDDTALTVAPSVGAYGSPRISLPDNETPVSEREIVQGRIAALAVPITSSILDVLPPIKRTALRRKHPRRQELTFQRGEKGGPIVALQVSQETLDRALRLGDALLRAADALGWKFDDPLALNVLQGRPMQDDKTKSSTDQKPDAEPFTGRILVEGEQVAFRVEERCRDEAVEPTAAQLARERRESWYQAPRKVTVATGALRVVRFDTYQQYGEPDRRSWYDRKGKLVEQQIPEILLGFYELAVSIKERRAKDEREDRERQEQERRRKEWEEIQEANQELIAQLEADAGAWHRARYLRHYLRAARKVLGSQRIPARFLEGTVDFLDWAERYVDQLDPLEAAFRTGEFEESSGYHFQNDLDRMKNAFGRLLGADWSSAWKHGKDYTPNPESNRQWHYGKKSVFEVSMACQ
jgi:hypothetical protein